jgi:hypothetical protein
MNQYVKRQLTKFRATACQALGKAAASIGSTSAADPAAAREPFQPKGKVHRGCARGAAMPLLEGA